MTTLKDLVWFARKSWAFLGCDRGRGRWAARRSYVKGFVRSARKFIRDTRADRLERSHG